MRLYHAPAMLIMAVLLLGAINSPTASAHELESDNGISAVLHIPPDDNPFAGRDTLLNFEFTSQRPGFDLRYCQCRVSFQATADRLQTARLYSNNSSPTRGHAALNFPAPGVYETQVQGIASLSQPSERFSLTYRVRVAKGSGASAGSAVSLQIILLGLTSLVLLGMVAASAISRGGRYAGRR